MAKTLSEILDGNVDAAVLITIGDTDGNGKRGIRSYVFADIPFDGKDKPVGVLTSPEYEPADAGSLLGSVKEATRWAMGVLGKIPVFPNPMAAKRANARRLSASRAPKPTKKGRG